MERPQGCILTIFGASGDLTKRKLGPALFHLFCEKLLPERFALLGVSRTPLGDETFRDLIVEGIKQYGSKQQALDSELTSFAKLLYYQPIDTSAAEDYAKVKARLKSLQKHLQIADNFIYYLSTPPSLYETIPRNLAAHGLNHQGNGAGWKRVIIEKPFGYDLTSAKALNATLRRIFDEDQIYRIDHYLGKETVQNILAFRFANGIFEPLWNRNYIQHVEITASEFIGVEDRGGYYDTAGALRDMVQNHLLQVMGTIAMEPPPAFDAAMVRNETVKVFHSLRPIRPEEVAVHVVRGQYTESVIGGEPAKGYRQERGIAPDSRTETFVALKAFIDNWRWSGVPFYVRTGKRLPTSVTEAVITFKHTPHALFGHEPSSHVGCNQLVIRIQPDEGILLSFGMKTPGAGFEIQKVSWEFRYADLSQNAIPTAYERLLLDCMLGDATLYARADAVEACWAYVMPILQAWSENPDIQLYGYPAGTWGPKEASGLFEGAGHDWRYPCKNLATDGAYCEL